MSSNLPSRFVTYCHWDEDWERENAKEWGNLKNMDTVRFRSLPPEEMKRYCYFRCQMNGVCSYSCNYTQAQDNRPSSKP